MKQIKYFLLTIISCLIFSNIRSQYAGPGAGIILSTVKEVISQASKLDKSDKLVKLQGSVIEQINKNTFIFKDSTGTIKIEIAKKQMPSTQFNEKTTVVIIGEVDYDLLEGCEIEVDSLIIKK